MNKQETPNIKLDKIVKIAEGPSSSINEMHFKVLENGRESEDMFIITFHFETIIICDGVGNSIVFYEELPTSFPEWLADFEEHIRLFVSYEIGCKPFIVF